MGRREGRGSMVQERERERERLVRDLPFRFSQRNRRYGRIYLFVCVCVSLSLFLSPFLPLSLSLDPSQTLCRSAACDVAGTDTGTRTDTRARSVLIEWWPNERTNDGDDG